MTRIVAGSYRGRRLGTPAGADTRPTSDRVREALFSTLQSMLDLTGIRFADLYAGSGAVGLEARSRGAGHVLLVESDRAAARAIRSNVAALGAGDAVTLLTTPVDRALAAGPGRPYDVIFADPPYRMPEDGLRASLAALVEFGWLAEDGVVVIERSVRSAQPSWVPGVTGTGGKRYGETVLWYGRRS